MGKCDFPDARIQAPPDNFAVCVRRCHSPGLL
jgi:hypothetical protein